MFIEEKDNEIGSLCYLFPVVSTLWCPKKGVRKIKTDGNSISQPTEVLSVGHTDLEQKKFRRENNEHQQSQMLYSFCTY